jgi:hypothetical protein
MSVPRRLARFLKRRPRDQAFVLESLAVVALVRLGLSTIGYRRLRRLLPSAAPVGSPAGPTPRDLARVSWAVTLASRRVPGATCLTQALAGHVLLARSGFASTIRVGAKTTEDGRFAAHAWLISGDTVVLGGVSEDVGSFAPLIDLGHG